MFFMAFGLYNIKGGLGKYLQIVAGNKFLQTSEFVAIGDSGNYYGGN
jgi:hypothetical protein